MSKHITSTLSLITFVMLESLRSSTINGYHNGGCRRKSWEETTLIRTLIFFVNNHKVDCANVLLCQIRSTKWFEKFTIFINCYLWKRMYNLLCSIKCSKDGSCFTFQQFNIKVDEKGLTLTFNFVIPACSIQEI